MDFYEGGIKMSEIYIEVMYADLSRLKEKLEDIDKREKPELISSRTKPELVPTRDVGE